MSLNLNVVGQSVGNFFGNLGNLGAVVVTAIESVETLFPHAKAGADKLNAAKVFIESYASKIGIFGALFSGLWPVINQSITNAIANSNAVQAQAAPTPAADPTAPVTPAV